MIVADTTIWIEFFKTNEPIFSELKKLIENGQVYSIEPIFGELLQGGRGNTEIKIIKNYWENIPKLEYKNIWIESGIYSSESKLVSKGVGLIDSVIFLSTIKSKSKIWSLDKKLLSVFDKEDIYNFSER